MPPQVSELNPNWAIVDCGCCGGLQWSSGYEPIECPDCWATGFYSVHMTTGTRALFPGGPLLGYKVDKNTLQRIKNQLNPSILVGL